MKSKFKVRLKYLECTCPALAGLDRASRWLMDRSIVIDASDHGQTSRTGSVRAIWITSIPRSNLTCEFEPVAAHDFPESDWKVFRELQQIALERFCERTLEEVQTILRDGSRTHHKRYLDVFRLLGKRNDELAHAFNDPRRSRMIGQLVAIHAHGLLEPDELERFTERTKTTVEPLAKAFTR